MDNHEVRPEVSGEREEDLERKLAEAEARLSELQASASVGRKTAAVGRMVANDGGYPSVHSPTAEAPVVEMPELDVSESEHQRARDYWEGVRKLDRAEVVARTARLYSRERQLLDARSRLRQCEGERDDARKQFSAIMGFHYGTHMLVPIGSIGDLVATNNRAEAAESALKEAQAISQSWVDRENAVTDPESEDSFEDVIKSLRDLEPFWAKAHADEVKAHEETKSQIARYREGGEDARNYCWPADEPLKWILRLSEPEQAEMIFSAEVEALEAFEKYSINWNCYLLAPVRRAAAKDRGEGLYLQHRPKVRPPMDNHEVRPEEANHEQ